MLKLSLLPKVNRILRYLLQATMKFVPCVASYETLWKMPTTLCKSTWRVYGLLIIFSASGFPVIIKSCNLQNLPAGLRHDLSRNMTSRLAIQFLTPYEWWSNSPPPGQEKASNARGGDVEASIWLVHYFLHVALRAIFKAFSGGVGHDSQSMPGEIFARAHFAEGQTSPWAEGDVEIV